MRTDIEWPRVYRTLEATLSSEDKIWCHLDSLYSVSVLESMFGHPDWNAEQQELVWYEIEHPAVLDRVLQRYLEPSMDSFLLALKNAAIRGLVVMIEPLLSLISSEMDENDDFERFDVNEAIFEYALDSAEHGHLSVLRLLLSHLSRESFEREDEAELLVTAALTSERDDMLEFALEKARRISTTVVHKLAIDQDSTALLEREWAGSHLTKRQTRSLFDHAVEMGAVQCMQLLAAREPTLDLGISLVIDMQMLGTATRQGMLPVLLSESRLDVMSLVVTILKAYPEAAAVLVAHPRVKAEELSDDAFRLVVDGLLACISTREVAMDKIRGLTLGEARSVHAWQVDVGSGLTRAVFRHIMVKMPSSMELMDWLVSLDDVNLEKASASVLRGEIDTTCDIPIQALLLCMLYPNLKLSDLLVSLGEAGVDYELCVLTGQLVGAHLGEMELRAREARTRA